MATESNEDDRLFVRDGWRHYRRRYSLGEFRWGLATFATLALIAGWVAWRARHPVDPLLFSDGAALLKPGPAERPITVAVSAPQLAPGLSAGGAAVAPGAASARGPLPANLAGPGWKEEKVAEFDEENLYVKIDGRADYFRAFHFKRLYSSVLVNEKDPAVSIDVEMYDLSNADNALGAYGGERPPDARVVVTEAGLHHFSRNALFVARGPYYVRVIGSDETPLIAETLQKVASTLIASIAGEPLPWAYGLFLGEMSFSADKITYSAKNAFSLAFADDVWAARPKGKENDLEIFASVRADGAAARQMASRLRAASLEMGEPGGRSGSVTLVKDRFLGLFSASAASDRFVIGVRGAASKQEAVDELDRLRRAIEGAPPALRARARPQITPQSPSPEAAETVSTPEAVDEK